MMNKLVTIAFAGIALCVALLAGASALGDEPKPQVLFNFDEDGALKAFAATGKIFVATDPLPAAAPQGAGLKPAGRAAHVAASASGTIYTQPDTLRVDWTKQGEISLWAYRTPASEARAAAPAVCELRLLEADGRAWFWRRVEVPADGWTHIKVPLAWMRIGGGRVPQWNHIERLAISFRGDSDVWLDMLAVTPGSPLRSINELRAIAFKGAKPSEVKVVQTRHVTLLTSAPKLEGDRLVEHLAKVEAAVRKDLPFLGKISPPPFLIVFSTREEYEAFTPRLAGRLASDALGPKSSGYTVEGIATSFWDEQQGTLRPVYTHEYVHTLLHHGVRLANSGEWVQEGLATRYQLQFHPQANFGEIVRTGVAEPRLRDPLQVLASGKPITQTRYWQAATLHEMLLSDESLAPRYADLIAAMQSAGSTELNAPLKSVLKSDWPTLERKWKEYCVKKYE